MAQKKLQTSHLLVESSSGRQIGIERELLVGTQTGFTAKGLSATHCFFQTNGHQCFVIDLKSEAGTLVDGVLVSTEEWTPLQSGQSVQAGDLIFTVQDVFAPVLVPPTEATVLRLPSEKRRSAYNYLMSFFDSFVYMWASYISVLTAVNLLALPATKLSFFIQSLLSVGDSE